MLKLSPIILMWERTTSHTFLLQSAYKEHLFSHKTIEISKRIPTDSKCGSCTFLGIRIKSTVAHGPTRVHLAKQPLCSWSTMGNVSRNGPSRRSYASVITQNVCQSAFRHNIAVGKKRNPCTEKERKRTIATCFLFLLREVKDTTELC